MARRAGSLEKIPQEIRSALTSYLTELEKAYPKGARECQIVPWPEYGEGSYLVKIAPLADEKKWLELSERMAEVGTRILIESDQLFILTT